jgi:hypothetical protein
MGMRKEKRYKIVEENFPHLDRSSYRHRCFQNTKGKIRKAKPQTYYIKILNIHNNDRKLKASREKLK